MSRKESLARRLIQEMRVHTRKGWARPWQTKSNRAAIVAFLEDIDAEDFDEMIPELVAHVSECAELIAKGRESAKFWDPRNLFGGNTFQRWRADIEAARAEDESRQRIAREYETRRSVEDTPDNVVAIPSALPDFLRDSVAKLEAVTGSKFTRKEDPSQLGLFGNGKP